MPKIVLRLKTSGYGIKSRIVKDMSGNARDRMAEVVIRSGIGGLQVATASPLSIDDTQVLTLFNFGGYGAYQYRSLSQRASAEPGPWPTERRTWFFAALRRPLFTVRSRPAKP
jgi:hypothetical protein